MEAEQIIQLILIAIPLLLQIANAVTDLIKSKRKCPQSA
jgi:hypothetical protein